MFKRRPWLWILIGFLAYVAIWISYIRFAGAHSPPPYDPENPPPTQRDANGR